MSCILFVIYLNVMACLFRLIGNDSFLFDIHLLMMMDDTRYFTGDDQKEVRNPNRIL